MVLVDLLSGDPRLEATYRQAKRIEPLYPPAQAMNCQTGLRVNQSKQTPCPRLRALRQNHHRHHTPHHDPHHAPALDQIKPCIPDAQTSEISS